MKVVFLEDVPNVATVGDVREVKGGFARNYLFPRSLAVLATPNELRRVEALKRNAAERREHLENRAEEIGQALEGLTVTIPVKATAQDTLYGSVSAATVAGEVSKAINQEITAREVLLSEPIKALGTHQTTVRLAPEVERAITIEVIRETGEAPEKAGAKRAGSQRERKPRAKKVAPVSEPPKTEEIPIEYPGEDTSVASEPMTAAEESAAPQVEEAEVSVEIRKGAVSEAGGAIEAASPHETSEEAIAEVEETVVEETTEAPPRGPKRARKAKVSTTGEADERSVRAAVQRAKRRVAKGQEDPPESPQGGTQTEQAENVDPEQGEEKT